MQRLPVNNFEWIKDTSHFNKNFIKDCSKESDEGHFLKLILNILKNYILLNHLPFLPERMKIGKVEVIVANLPAKNKY